MSDSDFEDFDPYAGLTDLTGDEPVPPLEHPAVPPALPPRSPLLTGLIVALLLVVLSVALFQLLSGDDEPQAAATTTQAPGATGTEGATTPADTTVTTVTSTTGQATDPTQAQTPFDPYEPQGEALPIPSLTLAVDGIGPIEFGQPAKDAIGRLVASLGEPDADSGPITSTGAFGGCEGELVRIVRWGAFVAIVVIDADGSETFGGYRVDLAFEDAFSSETTELATLSGLKVGDSIRRIEQIYESFDRRFVVDPTLGDTFELYSTNTGNLLLRGPITSPEPSGIVRGIYSPDACGRFQ